MRRTAATTPRRDAGEDTTRRATTTSGCSRFNDTPARCRGRPWSSPPHPCGTARFNDTPARCRGRHRHPGHQPHELHAASTTPRRDAGEDGLQAAVSSVWTARFNDTPARCRGRLGVEGSSSMHRYQLQRHPGEMPGKTAPRMNLRTNIYAALQRHPGEMPGKTWAGLQPERVLLGGFNDTPARCRGRPACRGRYGAGHHPASTTPRRDAGEDTSSAR